MAKEKFVIDAKYYVGRDFKPVQNAEVSMDTHPGPIQANIGFDGCLCIQFVANGAVGSTIHTSCAPYPTPENQSQQRIVSINDKQANFASGARVGQDCSIDAMIVEALDKLPAGWRDGVYLPVVDGSTYFINYANAPVAAADRLRYPGADCRVQVSFYQKF